MPTWQVYDSYRENQFDGNALNHDTPTGTFKIALLTSLFTPNTNTDEFWSTISANEVSGTNYTAGGNACANPTLTKDVSGNVDFNADDPADWLESASGFSNARRAVIYHDTGVAATSQLVAHSDDFGSDKGNTAGDFGIELSAIGIWRSAR